MELEKICEDIASIVSDLMYSGIEESFKADILDDILSIVGWDVAEGIEPDIEKVEQMLSKLIEFQDSYGVELSDSINQLNEYITLKTNN